MILRCLTTVFRTGFVKLFCASVFLEPSYSTRTLPNIFIFPIPKIILNCLNVLLSEFSFHYSVPNICNSISNRNVPSEEVSGQCLACENQIN